MNGNGSESIRGKTICIAASDGKSLVNFRGTLVRGWVSGGARVICTSIEPPEQMTVIREELGAEYVQIPGSRTGTGLMEGFRMIYRYLRFFRKVRPDMCFLYMSKPIAFGGAAARLCRLGNVNILVNGLENAYYRSGAKDALVRFIMNVFYRYTAASAKNVFFQNEDDLRYFKDHSLLKKDNASVIPGSGVDMDRFRRTPLPEKPVMLMTARLLWSKGIREYLEAAAIVKAEYPEAGFMLVGGLDHNDEAITEKELEKAVRENGICYCGYAPDVRPYLNRCSVFVLPSYHEGLPRSVTEAMAAGRPVITTDVPGCRETVRNGYNGYLVPARNAEALAEAIGRLVSDPELREKMGEASYRMCREKFEAGLINRQMNERMFS